METAYIIAIIGISATAVGSAFGAYVAVAQKLAALTEKTNMAQASATRAHERIDAILSR